MTAKPSRSASVGDAATDVSNAANLLSELPRRQMALLSQSACAFYRGSAAVRQIQQQAARRAAEHHQEAMEKLRDTRDFNELMAIQAELLRYNLQESAQYWQQLTSAVFKLQAEMISGAGPMEDPGAEPTLDGLQRAFAATLNGAESDTAEAAPH